GDQRSGGNLWGDINETAAKAGTGYDYSDAIPDLDAAIAYAIAQYSGHVKQEDRAAWLSLRIVKFRIDPNTVPGSKRYRL
ncbi:hypothetical protein ACC674_38990, partial [Rhizobium ruizarguesonis]